MTILKHVEGKQVKKRGRYFKDQYLYARIDWEKTSTIFQHSLKPTNTETKYPAVKAILHTLAKAGDKGLIFLTYGDKPGIENVLAGNVPYESWRMRHVFKRLVQQKYATVRYNENGSTSIVISKDGSVRALTYQLDAMKLNRPRFWDRKWRLVIYDVPEKHKNLRSAFRQRIEQLGLYQLQESVYVSPYQCFDEVEFLRELYGVAFTVRYLLVEKIEDDALLLSHFSLS